MCKTYSQGRGTGRERHLWQIGWQPSHYGSRIRDRCRNAEQGQVRKSFTFDRAFLQLVHALAVMDLRPLDSAGLLSEGPVSSLAVLAHVGLAPSLAVLNRLEGTLPREA